MTISPFLLWLWHFSIIGGPEMPLRHAQFLLLLLIATAQWGQISVKVEKILKGNLDLILSHSPSLKIQIMGGKVCLRCKGKTLLGLVNKLFSTKNLENLGNDWIWRETLFSFFLHPWFLFCFSGGYYWSFLFLIKMTFFCVSIIQKWRTREIVGA